MPRAKKSSALAVLAVALCFVSSRGLGVRELYAQQQFPTSPGQTPLNSATRDQSKGEPGDAGRLRFEEQAAKARNNDRFKRIQADTEKLLQLSTELKTDVDKSTKNEMSLDVIRKAAEIEKLAHDVKERMKG